MDVNVIIITILIFICCICIVINVISYERKKYFDYVSSLALIVLSSTLASITIVLNETNDINPLDIYRNKTELQITYKIVNNDTISCDSIVVYKNN